MASNDDVQPTSSGINDKTAPSRDVSVTDETIPAGNQHCAPTSTPIHDTATPATEDPVCEVVTTPDKPEMSKTPSVNAGKLTPMEIGKPFQTRLPNVTLPGPADGIVFSLDNLGVPSGDILSEEKDFDVARIRISDGLLTVFPKLEGEHALPIPIQTKDGKMFVTTFLLTVNPDPKSLWKDIPVPEGTPFAKPNKEAFHSDDGAMRIVAASQRGRTHAQQGTCRDDDMAFWSDPATGRYILVVADGAGSARFSREGSKIAVETTVQELSGKLTDAVWDSEGGDFTNDGNVCKVLVAAARTAVGAIDAFVKERKTDLGSCLADASLKDFNTTLLIAAVKRYPDGSIRCATFSIGDGAIAWWQPEKARLLCAPDGGEFSGQTKFLTTLSVWKDSYDVIQKARCFTFQKTPDEVRAGRFFLMTDGVSDPFFETDNLLRNQAEWDKFHNEQLSELQLFSESGEDAAAAAATRLLEWLSFWSVGNHDDRTIAVLGVSPLHPVLSRNECSDEEAAKPGFLAKLFGR